jgi:hypothetical protein
LNRPLDGHEPVLRRESPAGGGNVVVALQQKSDKTAAAELVREKCIADR